MQNASLQQVHAEADVIAQGSFQFKVMLHEAIFLATCNTTMTRKKPFKLQRGCYTQATCLATLRKVEGRSTFLATCNATIAVAKWGVTCEFFLATCCIASCKKNRFV